MTAHQLKHTEYTLHINSIAGYWSTFRAVLHTAYREHKIMENPNGFLERIDTIPTEKEHLSRQELVNLANTPCSSEVLKKAFLFSCLTGLRKSDIKQLTWNKIQPYGDGSMYITLRMQKTKELVNNPISNEALELIGFNDGDENRKPTDKVFVGFNDSLTQSPLKNWLKEAGITKHITYHCARHTLGLGRVIHSCVVSLRKKHAHSIQRTSCLVVYPARTYYCGVFLHAIRVWQFPVLQRKK